MPTSVSSAYSSPFDISGTLGLGTASLLGGDASNETPSAGSLLSKINSSTAGAFAALSSASTNSTFDQTTLQALSEGRLTGKQHKVIVALATAPKGIYNFDWSKGNEPAVLVAARKHGWIKLTKPTYNPATRFVTSADYELTTVGKAIYKRTDNAVATGPKNPGPPTLESLGASKINTGEEAAISAIATAKNARFTFKWPQGQEQSILGSLRKNGWAQLTSPNYDAASQSFTSATYKLTEKGQEIYKALSASTTSTTSASTSTSSVNVTA